jgi:hypothetical protein
MSQHRQCGRGSAASVAGADQQHVGRWHDVEMTDEADSSEVPASTGAERIEVQRAIAAPPPEIFEILSSPQGHVSIDASGMLQSASGEPVSAVGDTFVVHMDREALNDYPLGLYDVTVSIVAFEQDREIAWTILGGLDIGHVYGYRLEPIDGGTMVTSYYDWSTIDDSWKGIFPVISATNLQATLGILARTAAPGASRPGA